MNSGSILVVNAGSSSLKFSLFRVDAIDQLQLAARGQIYGIGSRPRLTNWRTADSRRSIGSRRTATIRASGMV